MRFAVLFTFAAALLLGSANSATGQTPPQAPVLVIRIINDLNRNGVADPDEPGVAGWGGELGCGDAFVSFPSGDAEGVIRIAYPIDRCINMSVPFGWLADGGPRHGFDPRPGSTVEVLYLVHQVGLRPERFGGSLIIDGLPAHDQAIVAAKFGDLDCGESQNTTFEYTTFYTLYAVGEEDKPGCPAEGDSLDITVNGITVASQTFVPMRSMQVDLVSGPEPMVIPFRAPSGVTPVPYIEATACGESRLVVTYGLPPPPDSYYIYVFPEAIRAGCGAQGKLVRIEAGGEVLGYLEWHQGFLATHPLPYVTPTPTAVASPTDVMATLIVPTPRATTPRLPLKTPTSTPVITLVDAGSSGGRGSSHLPLVFFAAAAGVIFLAGGLLARRRLTR